MILSPIRIQFHFYQRLQFDNLEVLTSLGVEYARSRCVIFLSNFFTRHQQMDRVTKLATWPVQEKIDSGSPSKHESGCFQRLLDPFQIAPLDQDVDVLRIPNSRLIHARNPGCHGIASDDRIWYIGIIQGFSRSQQTNSYFFHSSHHSV